MELSEFLLARIAEDEHVAALSVSHGTGGFPSAYWQRLYNGPGQHPVMAAKRLADECEAKRRIVEFYGGPVGQMYVLQFLALPYADHPDYDPAWAPLQAHAS